MQNGLIELLKRKAAGDQAFHRVGPSQIKSGQVRHGLLESVFARVDGAEHALVPENQIAHDSIGIELDGDDLKVECPTHSGQWMTLRQVAREINRRLCSLFMPDDKGREPWQGEHTIHSEDPHWKGLKCFNEYFHADTGRGCGADHQTGWTALIARCMQDMLAHHVAGDWRSSKEPKPPL